MDTRIWVQIMCPSCAEMFDTVVSVADYAARIAELEAALRAAQMELRATQCNWDEDCLYRCDDIMTRALLNDKSDEAVVKAFSGEKIE